MISKYGIFCKVIETGSFTKTGEELGYSQSAISQTIKSLERELGAVLIIRSKDGIRLTADGESFMPYIRDVRTAEEAVDQKRSEILGLENSVIRLGTFTSISRNLLPGMIRSFKLKYPKVRFELMQGEYTSISKWIRDGSVDFGFVSADAVTGLTVEVLYRDEMAAVLPPGHRLASKEEISLSELAKEPFILLDEGEHSTPLKAFKSYGIEPHIEYKVYDDYSIIAMIKEGLGVSVLYKLVLSGFDSGIEIRPIKERPQRPVGIAWKKWDTMPVSARKFAKFILDTGKVL